MSILAAVTPIPAERSGVQGNPDEQSREEDFMHEGAELICVLQFEGTERTITAVFPLGAPTPVSLPVTATWPDGSQSDSVEILIEQRMRGEVDRPLSARV
jgi:hypothetical protein